MKIKITFPDGASAVFTVSVKDKKSVEDIVDEIIDEMYRRQIKKGVKIHNEIGWKHAHKRWLLPSLTTALLEALHKFRVEEEETR